MERKHGKEACKIINLMWQPNLNMKYCAVNITVVHKYDCGNIVPRD